MAIIFPAPPTPGQTFDPGTGIVYTYDGTQGVWTASPIPQYAAINTPSITFPANGATGVAFSPNLTITGSAYSIVGPAGAHTTSTWEIYKALPSPFNPISDNITAVTAVSEPATWENLSNTLGGNGITAAADGTISVAYDTGIVGQGSVGWRYSTDSGATWSAPALGATVGYQQVNQNYVQAAPTGTTVLNSGVYIPTGGAGPGNVNSYGYIMRSTDSGATYTTTFSQFGSGQGISISEPVTDGAGTWVVGCGNNQGGGPWGMRVSTDDGVNWSTPFSQSHTSGSCPSFGATDGAGTFVMTSGDRTYVSNNNGASWSVQNPGSTPWFITYYNGNFYCRFMTDGTIRRSPDGVTWTTVYTYNGTTNLVVGPLSSINGYLVAGTASPFERLAYSLDGITWTSFPTPFTSAPLYIAPGNTNAGWKYLATYQNYSSLPFTSGSNGTVELSFATNLNLANMNIGDTVNEVSSSTSLFVSGIILEIDSTPGSPYLKLANVNGLGDWSIGSRAVDVSTSINAVPEAPSTNPPDPAIYTLADSVTDSTTALTSWIVPSANLQAATKFYVRVKYKSATNQSSYSNWSGFTTA